MLANGLMLGYDIDIYAYRQEPHTRPSDLEAWSGWLLWMSLLILCDLRHELSLADELLADESKTTHISYTATDLTK